MKKGLKLGVTLLSVALFLGACGGNKERSSTTGWKYNDEKWGGFEKLDYEGQIAGPNLVLIEGGTFTMGYVEEDVTYDWDNIARRVTVQSFYMDETEVANIDYREYLYWLDRVFSAAEPWMYQATYQAALPDTLVWREELAYNEPLVQTYFRHPSYDFYPVVGVNWIQANQYCQWRTDRVNEMLLIEKGILYSNKEQTAENYFNTQDYMVGNFDDSVLGINVRKNLKDLSNGETRRVRFEDGILLPDYRLPTEAEWEYAALALKGKQASELDERITDRRMYPWDDNTIRYQKNDKYHGMILANFKRSGGDYMGMAGRLNDNACPIVEVRSFMPNDFGLYNMAGNVSEWTADIYRPLTSLMLRDVESHDLNPYRGNEFKDLVLEDGRPKEKELKPGETFELGRLEYQVVPDSVAAKRDNYKRGKVYNYLDGDKDSEALYDYGTSTLISDSARVVKGGSWADRAYWLTPGTRRYKDQNYADRTIGFRCAMIRMGAPSGNEEPAGNQFKQRGRRGDKRSERRFK